MTSGNNEVVFRLVQLLEIPENLLYPLLQRGKIRGKEKRIMGKKMLRRICNPFRMGLKVGKLGIDPFETRFCLKDAGTHSVAGRNSQYAWIMHKRCLLSPKEKVTIILVLFFTILINFAYADTPEILFKLSFDKQTIDPDVAKDNADGKVISKEPNVTPRFDLGMPGHGMALVIGEGLTLKYDLKNNASYERGTLSLWMRRIGPRPPGSPAGNIYRYDLLCWMGDEGLVCYVYKWDYYENTTLLRSKSGGPGDRYITLSGGDADDGDWHLITFIWKGKKVSGYFDGKLSAEDDDFVLPTFNELLVGTEAHQGQRLIDDITFYADAMTTSEIKQMYRKGKGFDTPPFLTILPSRTPIIIDGKITEEEWTGAVETTGFVDITTGFAVPTPTHAKLCYDNEALYLALFSEYPQKVKDDPAMTIGMTGALQQTRTEFDTDVDGDDCFEIDVEPFGPRKKYYRLVFNGLNTHYDYEVIGDYDKAAGWQINLPWNPEWESASLLDGSGWHAEVRIPFSAFGLSSPKPGDTWGLCLSRHWKILQKGQDVWGFTAPSPFNGTQYGYRTASVKFGSSDSPLVALKNWGRVHQGFVGIDASILNPSDKELAIKVEVVSDSGELKETKTFTIPKGEKVPVRLERELKNFATSQVMMTVSSEANNEVVFRSVQLLEIPENLEIQTTHYPSKGLLRLAVDAGRLRDKPLSDLSLFLKLVDKKGELVVPVKSISPMSSYQCSMEIDVSKVPPGTYETLCTIKHKNNVIVERKIAYEKQELPEWYGNTLGISKKAPKPFTPVTHQGETLDCWGRSYTYERNFLPEKIITRGSQILAGPIELVLTDETGKSYSTTENKEGVLSKWKEHTEFRIDYERNSRLGGIPINTICWMECDGLLWTRLVVGPAKKEVQNLVLRIPLKKEWAKYVNTSDYSTIKDGFLPEEGLEGSHLALWLGNGYGGLQWLVETYATCRLPEGIQPLRVIPEENETILEITLIGEPTELKEPFIQEFGLIATPVRPQSPQYRQWNTFTAIWNPQVGWEPSEEVSSLDYFATWNSFIYTWKGKNGKPASFESPLPDDEVTRHVVSAPHIVISLANQNKSTEYAYWGDEWSPSSDGRTTVSGSGATSPDSESWRDFFVWKLYQVYKHARMPGVYYDCDMEPIDSNHYHGGGIKSGDKFYGKKTILGTRKLVQRIYTMLRELESEQTMIGLHASGVLNLAYMGWCDWYADGENFTSRLNKKVQDYHKIYRPDSFLAKSMGHNTGLSVRILDEQNRAGATDEDDWKRLGPRPTLHFYGLILLHDSGFWHAYGHVDAYRMVNAALIKYNFDERYRVFAWYFDQKIVNLPENVYATFYKDDKTGRVIIILLNNNDKDIELQLSLDWKALGFDDWRNVKIDDAIFHEGASIEDGKLLTPIGFANMRMLVLEL